MFIERSFDVEGVRKWSDDIKHVAAFASIIYVILTFGVRTYLKDRPGYQLRGPLFLWNVGLGMFSILGAIRTVPELVGLLGKHGWMHSICDSSFYHGQTGVWAYAFVFSKLIELGDTAFIVLRKQQLTFLHWYHHITVLLYCFYSYPQHISCGRWYMVMNYCVHSIMYSYYALKAKRVRIPRFVSMCITSLQIVQMVVGFGVTLNVFLVKLSGRDCNHSLENATSALLMYTSYLLLFLHFFYKSYTVPSSAKEVQANGVRHVKTTVKKHV